LKVLIFGNSNLGRDLFLVCQELGLSTHHVSRNYHKFSADFSDVYEADIIFNTVGGKQSDDSETLWNINITFNHSLLKTYPNIPIIAFSSNSALEPYRSHYGSIKKSLESLTSLHENFYVVRVSGLYGSHFPLRTFPGKLKNNYPKPTKLTLPLNKIQPTPTRWLAEKLITSDFTSNLTSIAPQGGISYCDWGKIILGEKYDITDRGYEPAYVSDILLSSTYAETWGELWKKYRI